MGLLVSKDVIPGVDQATSNSSLPDISSLLVGTKPKWKVFCRKEVVSFPVETHKPGSGKCSCGQNRECYQKVTPKGVTMHYPQKRVKFPVFKPAVYTAPQNKYGVGAAQAYQANCKWKRCNNNQHSKKFITWRLENKTDSPFKPTDDNPFGVSHGLPSCLRPTRKVITPRPYKPVTTTF